MHSSIIILLEKYYLVAVFRKNRKRR